MSGTEGETAAIPAEVARYRRADPDVFAVQLLDDDRDWDAIAEWCGGQHRLREVADSGEYDSYIRVPTFHGPVDATEGNWIVMLGADKFQVWEQTAFAAWYSAAEVNR